MKKKRKKKIKSERFTEYDSIKDQQSPWHMHTHIVKEMGENIGRKNEWMKKKDFKLKWKWKWKLHCPNENDWQWPMQWHSHFTLTNQKEVVVYIYVVEQFPISIVVMAFRR